MRITVFGATGGIGHWVVKFALDKGYEVTAFVRNPNKIKTKDSHLTIFQGQITDYKDIKKAVAGSDAVINALGLSMSPFAKDFPAVEANKLIIEAMKAEGVMRYIAWGTPSVHADGDEKSYITVVPSIMAGIFLRRAKKAMVEIARDVEKSGLEWTIVRFMAPKDTAHTGKVKISFGKEKLNFNISRADIADFMLRQVNLKEYIHRMPIIGS